jgi:thiol-disulfide isomerase/thioredoxin
MQSNAGRALAILALVAFTVMIAGCAGKSATPGDAKMAEIDTALRSGPVFAEFGATWCYWCDVEKPVIGNLSANYGRVTFVDVDADVNRTLADAFYVDGIPQMNIIVKKNSDGSYLYVDPLGNVTTDRIRSRIVGFHDYDELKPLMDAALAAR